MAGRGGKLASANTLSQATIVNGNAAGNSGAEMLNFSGIFSPGLTWDTSDVYTTGYLKIGKAGLQFGHPPPTVACVLANGWFSGRLAMLWSCSALTRWCSRRRRG